MELQKLQGIDQIETKNCMVEERFFSGTKKFYIVFQFQSSIILFEGCEVFLFTQISIKKRNIQILGSKLRLPQTLDLWVQTLIEQEDNHDI